MNTTMQRELMYLTVFLLCLTAMMEAGILFGLYDRDVPEILVGRIIGYFEAASASALAYWYQTSHSSSVKNDMLVKK